MKKLISIAALGLLGAGLLAVSLASRNATASAPGPCGTAHDAVSAEEAQLLGLLKSWRDANIAGSSSVAMEQSGALNAAAAWYAQQQVQAGPFGGHLDQNGHTWVQRARDCGYGSYAAGSGEGVYVVAGSGQLNVGPNEAMAGLQYPGSGISMPSMAGSSLPAKCVGVGVYREGNATAWVVIIAQYPASQPCPASTGAPPGPSPSSTSSATATSTATATGTSATATPTRTPTRTPTPTATPTRQTFRSRLPQVACDSCEANVQPTPTATTPTATATTTPTPSATASPGPAACGGTASIETVAKAGNPESVTITGTGEIGSWYLVSETGQDQRFTFPAGFVLTGSIDLISGYDGDPAQLPPGTIFWTSGNMWLNGQDDDAFLYDCSGTLRSTWDDGM